MKTLQDLHGPSDRISTREELHQVMDILLTIGDRRALMAGRPDSLAEIELDSADAAAAFGKQQRKEAPEDLLNAMLPLAELFSEDHERVN